MTLQERITEATEMRKFYADGIKFFAENRFVNSYSSGGNTLQRINLMDIHKMFQYWDNILAQLNGGGRRRFSQIVPMYN